MDKKKFSFDSGKVHTGRRQIRDAHKNIIREFDEDGRIVRDPTSRKIVNMTGKDDQMYFEEGLTNGIFSNVNFNLEQVKDNKYYVRLDSPYDIVAEVWLHTRDASGKTCWHVRDPYHFKIIAEVEYPSDALRIGKDLLLKEYLKNKNKGNKPSKKKKKPVSFVKKKPSKLAQNLEQTIKESLDEGHSYFKSFCIGIGDMIITFSLGLLTGIIVLGIPAIVLNWLIGG